MLKAEDIRNKVNDTLVSISYPENPVELYDPIRYSLSMGGKRLRPTLAVMACELFDGNTDNAIPAAIGLEIFHNFTLLHDDIMDEAPLRRGKDTVFKKWDVNRAILSGDTMFALAYQYMIKSPPQHLPAILQVFNQTAIDVCEGQQYDMNFENMDDVGINKYLEMIRLKTAVLLAASLKIGAILGGAGQQESDELYQFGEAIGMAFQVKDDFLDTYGDEEKFGKKKGGDIVANKKTYLYLKALQLADDVQQKALIDLFNDVGIEDEIKVREVMAIYDMLNIKNVTHEAIDWYYRQGIKYLDKLDRPDSKKEVLKSFTGKLMKRDF